MDTGDPELLSHIRAEIHYESGLASERLNSFISSQSFLIIAYASSMSASHGNWEQAFTVLLPPTLALLGLGLTLLAWPGIYAAQAVIARWRDREREVLDRSPDLLERTLMGEAEGSADLARRRREGALFARRSPLIFSVAWCWLVGLPIWFHWQG